MARLPILTGEFRTVKDPELRFTAAGKAVCSLTVIASESKRNAADTGWEDGDKTPFLSVTLWDQAAEAAAESITKGERVLVTGALFQREYDKSDGTKGVSIELKFATVAGIPGGKSKAERGQGFSANQAPTRTPAAADPWATPTNTDKPPF